MRHDRKVKNVPKLVLLEKFHDEVSPLLGRNWILVTNDAVLVTM